MNTKFFTSINPFTQQVVGEYPIISSTDVTARLSKASGVFPYWSSLSFQDRATMMLKVASILRSNQESLAILITTEMGKVIKESRAEVEKCASACEYYAHQAEQLLQAKPIATESYISEVVFQATGAVFAVMPWNYPFWQVFRFAVPALMAGNVAILKHAPNVFGCALAIEQIFRDAGVPEGVFQSLVIDVDAVEQIIASPIVQGVTFTGSELAGSRVATLAAKYVKKTVLELGGSDPFVILDNANVARAAKVAVQSRMLNAGQTCISAKRFIVVQKHYEAFLHEMKTQVALFRQGDPLDESNQIGPLSRLDLADKLHQQLKNSVSSGAKLEYGGHVLGCNFEPTLLSVSNVKNIVFEEETFGPVAAVTSVTNEEQAIALANDTVYGLGASLWTDDLEKGHRLAKKIRAGAVFVNAMVKSDPRVPFGGSKRSGYGRELGAYGLKEFMNIQSIVVEK